MNLEPDDDDPRRLWGAVLTALRACPGVPRTAGCTASWSRGPASSSEFLADLVDALDALPTRVRLVLDDAHNLVDPGVAARPATDDVQPAAPLRLVLATRRDPGLPVARMRLEEQLCELRAQQLRFSAEESALLLERNGIRLAAGHRAVLQERTGGWPAGLRLAALRLRAIPIRASFIASFSGDERPVADYLVGEVLDASPRTSARCCAPPASATRYRPARGRAVRPGGRRGATRPAGARHRPGGGDRRAAGEPTACSNSCAPTSLADLIDAPVPTGWPQLHRRAALWSSARGPRAGGAAPRSSGRRRHPDDRSPASLGGGTDRAR